MSLGKDKGKAPVRNSSAGGRNRDRDRFLMELVARHYDKKKRRTERRQPLSDIDLDDLQPIEHLDFSDGSTTDEEEHIGGLRPRSGNKLDALKRANDAMSEELAHLRAMIQRNEQLTNGATPGASSSRSGSGSRSGAPDRAYGAPVVRGGPAFKNPPAPPAPITQPTPDVSLHRFVALPKSKTSMNIQDIQKAAGLGDDQPRWLEISNGIRDLMTRVGLDYGNSWLRQDKKQLGILYSLILKEAPELANFQNGWATKWLVQNKFNNHRYYLSKSGRRRCASGDNPPGNDEEQGRSSPPRPPSEPARPKPSPPPSPPRPQPPLRLDPNPQHQPSPRSSPLPSPSPSPSPEPPSPRAQHQSPPPQEPSSAPGTPGPSSSPRPEGPRNPRLRGNPSAPGPRAYNTRTRAAAIASAEAQTALATSGRKQKRKAPEKTNRRSKKRPRRSDSPLRLMDEPDNGEHLTDEEY